MAARRREEQEQRTRLTKPPTEAGDLLLSPRSVQAAAVRQQTARFTSASARADASVAERRRGAEAAGGSPPVTKRLTGGGV